MFEFNMDVKMRDEIIFGKYNPERYGGGIRSFSNMSLDTVKKLLELKFMDPEEQQNDSPTIEEIVEYAENMGGGYVFGGYAVSVNRDDYRVDITTISKDGPIDRSEELSFIDKFRFADEFDVEDGLYAWYD